MNYIKSYFGGGTNDIKPSAIEVQQQTEDTAASLKHRRLIALQKVEELEDEAKGCAKKDPKRALGILKRRETYRTQVGQLEGQIANIEQLNMTVEQAAASKDVADSMRNVSKSMQVLLKELNIDDIQEIQDDLSDQTYELAEVTRALSEPIGGEQEDQNEALLKEIAGWSEHVEIEEAEKIENTMPTIPVKQQTNVNNDNNNGGGNSKPILATE